MRRWEGGAAELIAIRSKIMSMSSGAEESTPYRGKGVARLTGIRFERSVENGCEEAVVDFFLLGSARVQRCRSRSRVSLQGAGREQRSADGRFQLLEGAVNDQRK